MRYIRALREEEDEADKKEKCKNKEISYDLFCINHRIVSSPYGIVIY
jgi:hypothetical protein